VGAKDISQDNLDDEVTWLSQAVYFGKAFKLEFEKMTAMNRYSNRPGKIEVVNHE